VDASNVPVLTINLLQALPKTPLWDRLEKAGRLDHDPALDSNVRFLRPYDQVLGAWHRAIAHTYTPERLFQRFVHQMDATYRHRIKTPAKGQLTWSNIRRGLILGGNIVVRIGILSDYRQAFWRAAWQALKRGQIEAIFNMGFVAHHLIMFSRNALSGKESASFYSNRGEAVSTRGEVTGSAFRGKETDRAHVAA
jgi:hopanoid C-2 methylase